ncbi:MAG: sensor histidine kinase [Opitutaceae bacterium]|nr:sensor histidine kinase [Opitutaceae bacterium]
MNPLPRFLAVALFVVLVALVSLLAMSTWRGARLGPGAEHSVSGTVVANGSAGDGSRPAPRALALSQRYALGLGLVALALVLPLVVSLATRPGPSADSRGPFSAARNEIGTLARLAQNSVAQGEELSRERHVRRRAEEDAHLKQQLLTRSLEEKIRLGRDLHDGIIQSLYAVGLTIESVRALLASNPQEADRRLEQTRARINEAIRDVRTYITGLAPDRLREAGFAHALDTTLADLRSGRDTRFDIKIDDVAAALLTPEQALEALQIVREAVSNALRHGGASMITVRVHQGDREICLLVQDNGVGFDAIAGREGGHGLGNMNARATRIGATLRVTSRPGEGARVIATLPILQSTTV